MEVDIQVRYCFDSLDKDRKWHRQRNVTCAEAERGGESVKKGWRCLWVRIQIVERLAAKRHVENRHAEGFAVIGENGRKFAARVRIAALIGCRQSFFGMSNAIGHARYIGHGE